MNRYFMVHGLYVNHVFHMFNVVLNSASADCYTINFKVSNLALSRWHARNDN